MKIAMRDFDELKPGNFVRGMCRVTNGHDATAWGIKAELPSSHNHGAQKGIFWIPSTKDEFECTFELGFSETVLFVSSSVEIDLNMDTSQILRNLDEVVDAGLSGLILLDKVHFLGRSIDQQRNIHEPVVCSLKGVIRKYMKGRSLHDGACAHFPDIDLLSSEQGPG